MLPSATASTVVAVALCSTTATTVDAVALGSTMEHYAASIRCYGIYQSLLMWPRTDTLYRGMLFCYMEEPFLGLLNGRKLFHCRQPSPNMLPLLMLQRKHSGYDLLFHSFSTPLSSPLLFSQTINRWLFLLRTTSITRGRSTSIFVFISFDGSLKMGLFDLSTALLMIWSLTLSPRPYHPQRSNISWPNSDSH